MASRPKSRLRRALAQRPGLRLPRRFRIAAALIAVALVGLAGSYASFTATTASSGNTLTGADDWKAPTVDRSVIAAALVANPGFITEGGIYWVYANVTDTGNPASGTSTVTADVDNITSGTTAHPLVAGSYVVGGQSYNYRTVSPSVTADSPLTEGASLSYTITTTDNDSNTGSPVSGTSVTVDNTAPTIGTNVIDKSQLYFAGYVGQGLGYRVYANVTDGGSPAAGVETVTANVDNITSGQTAVAMTAGSYSAEGVSYGYRSALLTADNPLSAADYDYGITASDSANVSTTDSTAGSVTVNNGPLTTTDIQTVNKSGGTLGKAEEGDKIIFSHSWVLDPESLLAGWRNGSTDVVVRINDGGGASDKVYIYDSTNTTQVTLGYVDLARTDYVTANRTFGASGTASTMVDQFFGLQRAVTLGTASGSTTTAAAASVMVTFPSTSAYDIAGNAMANGAVVESGTNDKDF